jgi:hypothetical protein
MMEDREGYIRVINNTDLKKPIVGRYAGRDYVFNKGVPVDVPEIVARHVFDFGKDDKSQALARLGWAQSSEEIEAGMERLGQISFEDPPEMIEAPKPARGKKNGAKETGTAGPPVNASGTEGGDLKLPPSGPKIGQEPEDEDEKF